MCGIYPVEEPALFARAAFIEALRRNGVKATAAMLRPSRSTCPTQGRLRETDEGRVVHLAAVQGSDHRHAEGQPQPVRQHAALSVAASKGHTTAEAGLREERKILKELGVDVEPGLVRRRGRRRAGGSRHAAGHRATAAGNGEASGMARLQGRAAGAGRGWHAGRGRGADSPARGKVSAKTGTLIWTDTANDRLLLKSKALAGTMTTAMARRSTWRCSSTTSRCPTVWVPAARGRSWGSCAKSCTKRGHDGSWVRQHGPWSGNTS